MVSLNLFPWRKPLKVYQQKILLKMLLSTIFLTATTLVLIHFYLFDRINRINFHTQILQEEINNKLKVPKVNFNKENEIKKMLDYGLYTQQFFNLLSVRTPDFCFTEVMRNKHRVTFIGKAHSSLHLSNFLQNFRAAHLFKEIKVDAIDQINSSSIRFQFHGFESEKLK